MDNWRTPILNGGRSCRTQFWKKPHLITISAIFDLIWLSGLRGEDLNVKNYNGRRMDGRTYERRTSSDAKSSTGLSSGELKMDRRDRDRMVIGFTTTSAISAYHH